MRPHRGDVCRTFRRRYGSSQWSVHGSVRVDGRVTRSGGAVGSICARMSGSPGYRAVTAQRAYGRDLIPPGIGFSGRGCYCQSYLRRFVHSSMDALCLRAGRRAERSFRFECTTEFRIGIPAASLVPRTVLAFRTVDSPARRQQMPPLRRFVFGAAPCCPCFHRAGNISTSSLVTWRGWIKHGIEQVVDGCGTVAGASSGATRSMLSTRPRDRHVQREQRTGENR